MLRIGVAMAGRAGEQARVDEELDYGLGVEVRFLQRRTLPAGLGKKRGDDVSPDRGESWTTAAPVSEKASSLAGEGYECKE